MTSGLRGGEVFATYLIKSVRDKLEDYEIPKKRKRQKLENGAALEVSDFKDLQSAWPYLATESEFAKLITLLTSKQATYTWRLMSEFLNDELADFDASNENKIFLIDLLSALLCQFLANTQLAEHSHLYWDVIDARCKYMRELLALFGRTILGVEHNRRLMNAFLSLCHEFAGFEAVLWYYCPDSVVTDASHMQNYPDATFMDLKVKSRSLLSYLTADEWQLIEQRVKNFGKFDCAKNLTWLNFDKLRTLLVCNDQKAFRKQFPALSESLKDDQLLVKILADGTVNEWVVAHLEASQLQEVVSKVMRQDREVLINENLLQNAAFVEAVVQSAFQQIFKDSFDFSADDLSNQILKFIASPTLKLKNDEYFQLIKRLPLGFLNAEVKVKLFGLLLASTAASSSKLYPLISEIFHALTILEECPNVLQHFTFADLRGVLNHSSFEIFWQDLINQLVFNMSAETLEGLKKLVKSFKKDDNAVNLFLCTKVLKCLSAVHYVKSRAASKEDVEKLEHKYADAVFEHLKVQGVDDQSFELFFALLQSYVKRKNKSEELIEGHNRLLAAYLEGNFDSVNLPALAALLLENKAKFSLDEAITKRLLDILWENVNEKTIGLIYDLKTQPELEELLSKLENSPPAVICRTFQNIAEHAVTKNKTTAALAKNEALAVSYRRAMHNIEPQSDELTREVLKSHIAVVKNLRIPVSADLVDECLLSLVRVNIRGMAVTDENEKTFIELHQLMAELMFVLVSMRAEVTLNFLQTFLMVFENLLAAISLYKSDRKSDEQLSASEISLVADLAHKLEK